MYGLGETVPRDVANMLDDAAIYIQDGLAEAKRLNLTREINIGNQILQDWLLAQKVALEWKDYPSARRTLNNIMMAIFPWIERIRQAGGAVAIKGVHSPAVKPRGIVATLTQATSGVMSDLPSLPGVPSWLLPVGAGLLLFLLLRR